MVCGDKIISYNKNTEQRMMTLKQSSDINEDDCCGNGCANCILYAKSTVFVPKTVKYQNKQNILATYKNYKLLEKIILNTNLFELKFECITKPENSILLVPPGHHVMMKTSNYSKESSDKNYITRPYSPFWINEEQFQFKILVNLSPNGNMSKYIRNLHINDIVEFRGPIGSYEHKINSCDNLLIFTHGVAISPIIRIIDEILENENDMTRIHLIGCFANLENIIFREKIHEYKSYWNFNANFYLPYQNCVECKIDNLLEICNHFKKKLKYNENVKLCRLNENNLREMFNLIDIKQKCNVVISGSKEFINFIENNLKLFNVSENCIFIL